MPIHPISTFSLRSHPHGDAVARILMAGLEAVDPYLATRRYLQRDGDHLIVQGRAYPLQKYQRVFLVAVGKAGAPMARAAAEILGDALTKGLVIVKHGHIQAQDRANEKLTFHEAGHPIPDVRGVDATREVVSLLDAAGNEDLILFLVSGGGSALFTAPVPPVTLDDLQQLTAALLACGAEIREINSIRKHLDAVKGGGVARLAYPAHLAALVLSDVVGDALESIASGPTVPDPSTFADALGVIERYGIIGQVPAGILHHLQKGVSGMQAETPKPGSPIFENVHNSLIGSNYLAVQAMVECACQQGFTAKILATDLQGEAREVGQQLVDQVKAILRATPCEQFPLCLAAGGETTVTIHGNGLGGRNQELALSMVAGLSGVKDVLAVTLATDGGDGPTDAAGAVMTGETLSRAAALGLDAEAYLDNNDAYHFFEALDDLVKTGPTQTNVNDLTLFWIKEKPEDRSPLVS
ncbi:MAG: glycerate kinase [Anaerolineaceae bacterium]|nr:glycerate kinase [Anaerolineaceae bacterium]